MTRRLFVYGTLRADAPGRAARLLGPGARVMGPARARGTLYALDGYPGLVPARGPAVAWVHGELVDLGEASGERLARLDDYEGCGAGDPAPREFERVLVEVLTDSGAVETAWTYAYRGSLRGRSRIPSGDWLTARS